MRDSAHRQFNLIDEIVEITVINRNVIPDAISILHDLTTGMVMPLGRIKKKRKFAIIWGWISCRALVCTERTYTNHKS